MKKITIDVAYDEARDQIILDSPGGQHIICATNDGPTWQALGESLVRDVKAFGKLVKL